MGPGKAPERRSDELMLSARRTGEESQRLNLDGEEHEVEAGYEQREDSRTLEMDHLQLLPSRKRSDLCADGLGYILDQATVLSSKPLGN